MERYKYEYNYCYNNIVIENSISFKDQYLTEI